MKKIKIAIICTRGFGADGITTFVMNNYRYFDHSQLQCTIIFSYILGKREFAIELLSELETNGDDYKFIDTNKGAFSYIKDLREVLIGGKYDIAYIHGSSSSLLLEMTVAKLARIKCIIPHSHNTMGEHVLIHKLLRPIVNKFSSIRLGCSRNAAAWMYGKHDCYIIPNGIDTAVYQYSKEQREKIRNILGISNDEFVFGHVGGFNKQKNQAFLIYLIAKLKNEFPHEKFRLLLVGRGSMQSSVESLAKNLNVQNSVIFLGQRSDVSTLLCGMDMFLLPSLFEGFPIVAVEAQASGLPILMADTITEEIKLTDLVQRLSLDSFSDWIDAYQKWKNVKIERGKYSQIIKDKGFDIKTSSDLLQNIFLKTAK